jgi:N-formylglutamate deformylase
VKPFLRLAATDTEVGVLASIPHTGTWMPDELEARLASDDIRAQPMCDWHLHELYDFLPSLGVTVVHATVSRFVVDLNRSPEPLALYPGRMETAVVPELTFWGDAIWDRGPNELETTALVHAWHRPYHAALATELVRLRDQFGRAVLLDLHSVASRASRIHDALVDDIYLGDRDGTSCPAAVSDTAAALYERAGFRVARNMPYKGGYITHHYGQQDGVDALQVEMVQRVYMDEVAPSGAPDTPRFAEAKTRLQALFGKLIPSIAPV